MRRRAAITKGLLSLTAGVLVLSFLVLALPSFTSPPTRYGVTFSQPQASGLGLDWQKTYRAILADLGVRQLRLVAYWDHIEKEPQHFDFTDLDYQMDLAAEYQAEVILAIGRKLPRWPECHVPPWARHLSEAEQQARVEAAITAVVARYQHHPSLRLWQLENEPLLDFGLCPPVDLIWLKKEIALVRSLDTHPIVITDSGELNWWLTAADFGDVLGTTMYRTVFSNRTQKLFSYDYIFPAWLYRLKARLVRAVHSKEVFIAELQGEPWGAKPFTELSAAERAASISPARVAALENFARRTQISPAYWWGVEFWYWEKEKNNNPAYWELARTFFRQDY